MTRRRISYWKRPIFALRAWKKTKLRMVVLWFVFLLIQLSASVVFAYVVKPRVFYTGMFPIQLETGREIQVRYSVNGIPCVEYFPDYRRAKAFVRTYLPKIGIIEPADWLEKDTRNDGK